MCSDKHIVALIPSKVKLMIVKIVFSASQFKVDSHMSICRLYMLFKPGIHDTSFASKYPFKFLEFKFFDRVYHTRNLNQNT